ncbi:MAG: DUF2283 domain-containing protein [Chloroflexi bacterium]|nr:DUF2283 domain-containing protein [Chloroflexota bacterium]
MSTGNERLGPPLSEALPSLAAEVMELLRQAGQEELTSQIPTLHVRSRCNCGDDFCATIHTGAGRPVDSIDLEPTEGMIILDVDAGERIVGIEVLYRDEYKEALDALLPIGGGRHGSL